MTTASLRVTDDGAGKYTDGIAAPRRAWKRFCLRGLWLLCSLPAFAQTGNPVYTEGFENSPHYPETVGVFTPDSSAGTAHSGSTAIKVVGSGTQQYMALPEVKVEPNGAYRVSLWIKSHIASSAPSISVNALQVDANRNAVGWYRDTFKLIQTGGLQKWTQYSATLTDMDPRAASVKLYLRVDAGVAGTVWFDDVSVAPFNLLSDAGFEKALWPESGGGGSTRTATDKHSGTYSAQLVAGSTQRYIASARVPITASEAYDLSLWVRTTGFTRPEHVAVNVLQVDANDKPVGWYRLNGDFRIINAAANGNQAWTRKSIRLSNFAPNTAKLQIHLRTDSVGSGTAWFDDVNLSRAYNDDFVWGINDHASTLDHRVYPEGQLGARLDKAVALGARLYRVNRTPRPDYLPDPTTEQAKKAWEELDNLVEQAFQRRLKVFLVLFADGPQDVGNPAPDSLKSYRRQASEIAHRYKGKIAYYQLGNELDNLCINEGASGENQSDYPKEPVGDKRIPYDNLRDWLLAVSAGIREGDPDAKRAININWTHFGFLEKLNKDGVQWEVTGLDWYWGLGPVTLQEPHPMSFVLDRLEQYPQPEVLITEGNINNGTLVSTEAQQADYIERIANEAYYRRSADRGGSTKLKGFLAYELLDRPRPLDATGDDALKDQRHYGLIHYLPPPNSYSDTPGAIGTPKPAYDRYRQVISRKR